MGLNNYLGRLVAALAASLVLVVVLEMVFGIVLLSCALLDVALKSFALGTSFSESSLALPRVSWLA